MTMNRHEPYEELISASLHGDLSADERQRLDAHLDTCDRCRGTLAAFAEERRMIAGLRHVAPPRDLGARVRAGIEYASIPWWRKPTTIFTAVGGSLAAVAGALLALAMLNGAPSGPEVGQTSPDQSPEPQPTASAPQSLPDLVTPAPTLDPGATPLPSTPTPQPTATPVQVAASPEPDLIMALDPATPTEDEALTLVEGSTGEVVLEPDPPADPPDPSMATGEPIAAELSSDGGWLAYVSREGLSGMNQVLVTRVGQGLADPDGTADPTPTPPATIGETIAVGTSAGTSPFLERLAWSPDSRFLAYTLADPDGAGTDAWIFDTTTKEHWQLTAVGDAYAGSWVTVDPDEPHAFQALWVSTAEGQVTSYLVSLLDDTGGHLESIDPAGRPLATAEGVFQPLISPNGALAIYWNGRMTRTGEEWVFSEGGAPWLSEHRPFDEEVEDAFPNERPLFSDLTIDRDAFTSAAIAWGVDGNSYAVWQTEWTGLSQDPDGGTYPDPTRIYFGRATDGDGLTRFKALDRADVPEDWSVVDVKVSPTGRHLVVMVAAPRFGTEAPTANLLLITRNLGDVPDDVEPIEEGDGQWFGPAVFDGQSSVDAEAETP